MELQEKFAEKCEEIYLNINTREACQDEFVMLMDFSYDKPIIDIICSNKTKRDSKYIEKITEEDCDTIALILESPHKSEYNDNGNALGPAMGQTGENISEYLFPKLKTILKEGVYKIVLIEAVSFQCSNGEKRINSKKRDDLFVELWKNGAKDDFKKRLEGYQPKYIINACSGGVKNIASGKTLNSLVDQAIREIKYEKYFYSAHPCSRWFIRKPLKEREE